ncbi:MAG TPA: DegV family protein [Anaerolineales bacterium]|nr:DegV family protein [Anaerolineales bacterium]
MPNVCILTDSTAQFTQPRFPGHERVHVIPFGIQEAERSGGRPLPGGLSWPNRLASPSVQEFIRFYTRLSRDYDAIVVMTLSSQLDAAMRNALAASEQFGNGVPVEVIDSQATALGLGLLVQIAAEAASRGASVKEIERLSRASIPRVYMLLCIPELTYLAHSGLMGYAQALVGEMMGILPIFTFEEGCLVPMEKVRTPRHLFEAFQDFLGEFETPVQIALISNAGHGSPRTNPLRQFVQETFPETPFGEHLIQPHLAALFGPRCIGLVVLDSLDQRRR